MMTSRQTIGGERSTSNVQMGKIEIPGGKRNDRLVGYFIFNKSKRRKQRVSVNIQHFRQRRIRLRRTTLNIQHSSGKNEDETIIGVFRVFS